MTPDDKQVPFIREVGPVPGYLDEQDLAMIRFACDEARRLGLELGMQAGAGWSGSGGPWITPKHAYKHLRIAEAKVEGGKEFKWKKPSLGEGEGFVGCVAFKVPPAELAGGKPVTIPEAKKKLGADNMWDLYYEWITDKEKAQAKYKDEAERLAARAIPHAADSGIPADAVVAQADVVDLTPLIAPDGTLTWQAPAGEWKALTATYGINKWGNSQIMAMPSGAGKDVDRTDPEALDCHWKHGIQPVLDRIGDHAGATFKFIQLDSHETGNHTWGARVPERFQKMHGYSILPWLPALTGRIQGSPDRTERFLRDYRKTLEVLSNEGFYAHMTKKCREHGLQFVLQPYCRGTFGGLSSGKCADILQGEFWSAGGAGFAKRSYNLRNHQVLVAASAARTSGRRLVTAESFTSYLSHSMAEYPPTKIKMIGDNAWCDGVNAFWVHEFPLNPYPNLRPGMYFGIWGINFNPNALTWRDQMPAWTQYVARCQALLQAGRYVADFLVHDPSEIAVTLPGDFPFGFRFDIGNDDTLLELRVDKGELVLPAGMRYRCLMLPSEYPHFNYRRLTPEVLSHIAELVKNGATVLGERPLGAWTLANEAEADKTVARLSDELWPGYKEGVKGSHACGKGKVFWGCRPDEWAREAGLAPDFARDAQLPIDFIHYRDDAANADWYFVAHQNGESPVETNVRFRVTGRAPELWNPITGEISDAFGWSEKDGVTEVRLSLPPAGSVFVVFRKPANGRDPAADSPASAASKQATVTVTGPWTVKFDPALGGPAAPVEFKELTPLNEHADPKIKYYSGPAVYSTTVEIPAELIGQGKRLFLDVGRVCHTAGVSVNGQPAGVLWCPPYAVEITSLAQSGKNTLAITAVNDWRNRWIGDEQLPPDVETETPAFGGKTARSPVKFPDWAKRGDKSPTGRILFATYMPWRQNDPLEPAGLLGPVVLRCGGKEEFKRENTRK